MSGNEHGGADGEARHKATTDHSGFPAGKGARINAACEPCHEAAEHMTFQGSDWWVKRQVALMRVETTVNHSSRVQFSARVREMGGARDGCVRPDLRYDTVRWLQRSKGLIGCCRDTPQGYRHLKG